MDGQEIRKRRHWGQRQPSLSGSYNGLKGSKKQTREGGGEEGWRPIKGRSESNVIFRWPINTTQVELSERERGNTL